jgi:predicted DNA-binding protein with PD1-like motif
MIFAQVESGRTFVGCLVPGSELVGSLAALCEERGIQCAWISGCGHVQDPSVARYSRAEKSYLPAQKEEGLFLAPSIQGSISIGAKGKPEVQLYILGMAVERGRSRTVVGKVAGAAVLQFEFTLQSIENVQLRRVRDKESGLDLWLQMLPAGYEEEEAPSTPVRRSPFGQLSRPVEDDDDLFDEDFSLGPGDWLNHPRLGMCAVVTHEGEERIRVRLASGRIAELLLSMFKLTLEGAKEEGKVYRVEVKKRK